LLIEPSDIERWRNDTTCLDRESVSVLARDLGVVIEAQTPICAKITQVTLFTVPWSFGPSTADCRAGCVEVRVEEVPC
jgi:hypothetical protein